MTTIGQTVLVSNDLEPRNTFALQAVGLGVGVVVLIVAAIVTLFSLTGDDDANQLTIGTTVDEPNPTFDASISDADDRVESSAGRDLSITDEPIVIDADGNIVDLAGGNGAEPLPSESESESESEDDGTNLLGGDDPEDKRMPDLICRGLQAAQDEIQDRGVFGSKSKDATDQGRRQIWDRNWIVVAQDPEPGEKIGEFDAILYVVKKDDDENTCP